MGKSVAKTKKRQHRNDHSSAVVIDGDEFPAEITVELWQRRPKGKRTLVGSRRYEIAPDLPDSSAGADTAAVVAAPEVTEDGVAMAQAARPASAKKGARQTKQTPPPSA